MRDVYEAELYGYNDNEAVHYKHDWMSQSGNWLK